MRAHHLLNLDQIWGWKATSLTRSLNNLEKLGVIERRKDPNDKRKTIIHLTEFGS